MIEKNIKRKIDAVLFWMHSGIIFFGLFLGIFVSLQVLLLILFAHRVHFIIFNGCLISKLHERLDGFPENMNFLQFTFFKFSGKKISEKQSHILDYSLVIMSICIAIIFY